MIPAGKIVCFHCRGSKGNRPLIKLEVRRKGKNPKKKGKVIAEAWVCDLCHAEGWNKVPFGDFNGEYKMPTQLPPKMVDFLQKQKEAAQKKLDEQKQEPIYPLASKPRS